MRSKHSYIGHLIFLRRIKRAHLQAEGDEERKEKAKIVVMIPMVEGVLQDIPSNEEAGQREGSSSMSNEVMPSFRSIQALYEATDPIEEECLISLEEPTTYSKASEDEAWRKAMEEEITSIEKNDTWKLVKAPESCKPIGVKWLYKLKKNLLGEIVKHKARLVVKGYRQRYGIDYDEVFSPVAHFE